MSSFSLGLIGVVCFFYASLLSANDMKCSKIGNTDARVIADVKSPSPASALTSGARRLKFYNDADGVVKLFQVGPKLSDAEAHKIADLLDFVNDHLIDASGKLDRPELVYLFASLGGADAFWTKPGRNHLKTVMQFVRTLGRVGVDGSKVMEKLSKRASELEKEALSKWPVKNGISKTVAEKAMAKRQAYLEINMRKEMEIARAKNPAFSEAITLHEYFHVVFDSYLAKTFPRLQSVNEINGLRHQWQKNFGKIDELIAEVYLKVDAEIYTQLRKYVTGETSLINGKTAKVFLEEAKLSHGPKTLEVFKKIMNYKPLYEEGMKRFADLGYEAMFGKAFDAREVPAMKTREAQLLVREKSADIELDLVLKEAYKILTPKQAAFFTSYKVFKEETLNLISYGLANIADLPEFSGAVVERLIEIEPTIVNSISLRAQIENVRLQISRDPVLLQEAAVAVGQISHQLMSKFHELTADVGTVLLSKNNGRAVFSALNYSAPNRFRNPRSAKITRDRDATSRRNRIDKWVVSPNGHSYFAPVRKHLYDNYFRQPKFLTFEGRGVFMDNYLNAVTKMLEPLNSMYSFTDFGGLKASGLLNEIDYFSRNMTPAEFAVEIKKNPFLRSMLAQTRVHDLQRNNSSGKSASGDLNSKILSNNQTLIDLIDTEFKVKPYQPTEAPF